MSRIESMKFCVIGITMILFTLFLHYKLDLSGGYFSFIMIASGTLVIPMVYHIMKDIYDMYKNRKSIND